MAKNRTYKRDSRGRFAGNSGSLSARVSARNSKRKLAAAKADGKSVASIRSQKGAVTRTTKAAKAARIDNRRKLDGQKLSNVVTKPKGLKPGALAVRRAQKMAKRRPPAAVNALVKAGVATFTAGQMARARLNRMFSRRR